jgi:hypothetical protein
MAPMTQYDAAATPLWRCFDKESKPFPFKALIPGVSLLEKSTAINKWQKASEKMNFAKEDSNNDIEFNNILWHAIKGDIPFPGPRRAAFLNVKTDADDDDE